MIPHQGHHPPPGPRRSSRSQILDEQTRVRTSIYDIAGLDQDRISPNPGVFLVNEARELKRLAWGSPWRSQSRQTTPSVWDRLFISATSSSGLHCRLRARLLPQAIQQEIRRPAVMSATTTSLPSMPGLSARCKEKDLLGEFYLQPPSPSLSLRRKPQP